MLILILFAILISLLVRVLTAPFRFGGRRAYNPYRYGCCRRHTLLGGVLPIIALVAFDRLFGGRRF